MNHRAALFLAALSLLACTRQPAADAPLPVEKGVTQALAEHRKQQISRLAYAIELTIPAGKAAPIPSTETVAFDLKDNRQPLQLDFKAPTDHLQTVVVNGQAVAVDHRAEHLMLPTSALRKGRNEVAISFTAGDLSLNRNADYLYTLLVPDRARTVLPVFDQPDLKAVFTLTLTVPPGWQAVANGPLRDSTTAAGATTYRFAPSDTISTYLFSFVAGRFDKVSRELRGRAMHLLHRETDTSKIRLSLDPIFQIHADALAFMQEYTQLPYPFQKFDFVALPDFQYGGMEHAGAIDYKASSLFLDEGATQDQQIARSNLISHETAHMWFGDLVTMRWFDDVWMKEVFANFMADKITQVALPGSSYDLKFVTDHYPAAYAVDRTAGANPIRQPLANLRDAGTLYGNIIYHKAPIMMRQLERLMGPDAFQAGLRDYLRQYANGNATWPDLIRLLDARTPADLLAWNQVWVNEPGRPLLTADLQSQAGRVSKLTVRQQAEDGSDRLWPQVFEVRLVYADGSAKELTVNLNQHEVVVPEAVGLPAPDYLLYNSTGLGYGVFPVAQALPARVFALADPVARAAAYLNLYENLLRGQALTPAQLLAVDRRGLTAEPEELNLRLLTGQLGTLFWQFTRPAARAALAPTLEADIWRAMQQNPAPNAKKLLFKLYQNVALTPAATARLFRVWQQQAPPPGVKLTEDDYTALALALAVRDYAPAANILPTQLARIQNPDRRQRMQFLLPALSPDPTVRDVFFASLQDEKNREKEAWVTAALGYLHHPLRQATSEKYLPQSLALLEEVQQTGDIFFPGAWLQATLGAYQSPAAAGAVRAFLQAHPDYNPRLRAKILQSADDVFRAEKLAVK